MAGAGSTPIAWRARSDSESAPSLRERIAAHISANRYVRHNLGLKAPRGWGWVTNPRKAAYNRVYNRTTVGCLVPAVVVGGAVLWWLVG